MASLTSANATYLLSITALYPVPQQLQQWGVDEAWATDELETSESVVGVDGFMSSGFVYSLLKQHLTLQADSQSNDIFEQWWTFSRQNKDVFFANGLITVPSINKKYTFTKGALGPVSSLADGGRILKQRKYTITWESVVPSIMAGVA